MNEPKYIAIKIFIKVSFTKVKTINVENREFIKL